MLGEEDDPAATVWKLIDHAVKHDGTLGQFAFGADQTIINVFTEIDLQTANGDFKVLETEIDFDTYVTTIGPEISNAD
jgi:hypothetical protein